MDMYSKQYNNTPSWVECSNQISQQWQSQPDASQSMTVACPAIHLAAR